MNLSPLPIQKFFDNNGAPLVGGLLFTYVAGTTTKIATYIDSSGGTQNTNPVVLDYRGEANVWLDNTKTYKFVLSPKDDTDPPTHSIWTEDNLTAPIGLADLTQQIVGKILWPQTAAESSAGVTPTNYAYIPTPIRDISRYVSDNTGATDVTAEINAALAAGLNELVMPAGTYKVTGALTPPSGLSWKGAGRRTKILGAANINGIITLDGVTEVELRDMLIDGQIATYTNSNNYGVYSPANGTGVSKILLENIWVENIASSGIIFLAQTGSHSSRVAIRGGGTYNTGGHGIICQDYVDDVEVVGADVRDFGMIISDRPGITVGRSAVRQKVHHCTVVGSLSAVGASVHGISLDGTAQAECDHNHVETCVGYGIEVGGVDGGSVNGNTIKGCSRPGIGLSGAESSGGCNKNVALTANEIQGCTGGGIYSFITGATGAVLHKNITLDANVVRDCAGYGAWLNLVDGLTIGDGNIFQNNTQSGVIIQDCQNVQWGGKYVGNNTSADASHAGVKLVASLLSATQSVKWLNPQFDGNGSADVFSGTGHTVFSDGDATPSVKRGKLFITANTGATTITNLDDGIQGDEVLVLINDANTTVDFTGSNLKGNGGVDWVPGSGDFMRCRKHGANWYCDVVEI